MLHKRNTLLAYTEEQKKNIETALQKILASAGFSNSNQLSNFLSFIVKKTIDDKAHEIKGYTIGVDALGRPEDFDPQIDPSVRVMAGRLRQALENYNRDNNQAIKIELIKGSYVPKIEFTDQKLEAIINYEEVSTVKIATQKASKIRPWLLVITTSIACLILFNFIHFFYVKNKEFTSTTLPEKQSISIENATLPSLTLYIDADSEKMPDWITAEKIHSTAVVVLSRFHEYRIFDYNMENEPLDLNKNASDYYLSMYFAKAYADQSLEAFLTLTRPKENQIIWSDKIIFPPSKGEQAKANLQQIAIRTSEIMSPYGIIHSDITSNKSSQPSLNCIRAIYSYFAKEDLQSYSNGLDCARRAALGKNPSSSMYSMLTFMYVEAYRKQITEVSENPLKDADM